ncbi:MAG TPA: DUF2085 domain-containing protein [Thermoanaerobaculia bacterium]|nr:DUF2085 domain-containing protein [Thermoanaerobaculia bacterium]
MKRNTRIVAAVIASIASAILAASTLCTWAIANGASMRWRLLFRMLCHGIPNRCIELWHVPMPICARCTAIYGGFLAGILLFIMLPRIQEMTARWILGLAALPIFLDGITQLARLRESTNPLRIETGLIAGAAFALWALSEVESHVLSTA